MAIFMASWRKQQQQQKQHRSVETVRRQDLSTSLSADLTEQNFHRTFQYGEREALSLYDHRGAQRLGTQGTGGALGRPSVQR
jgi:hypothetical protein